jgi:hypothetical protein
LDEAVTRRVLQAVDAEHLALALAAHDELTQRDEAILQQWKMRLQRAQYEADLAQRRYEQVDAANRLVAASLESRWNESLQRLDEVRHQITDFQRQQTRTFAPEQREQILALARNLPRLWQAETTSAKDRKRLLRLLVQDITVERGQGREVHLHMRWFGGECEVGPISFGQPISISLRPPVGAWRASKGTMDGRIGRSAQGIFRGVAVNCSVVCQAWVAETLWETGV